MKPTREQIESATPEELNVMVRQLDPHASAHCTPDGEWYGFLG